MTLDTIPARSLPAPGTSLEPALTSDSKPPSSPDRNRDGATSDSKLTTAAGNPRTPPLPNEEPEVQPYHELMEGLDHIEVDPSPQFSQYKPDSGYDEEVQSLASSTLAFPFEYGRRFHAYRDGKYILPNDEREADRLDMTHHMMSLRLENKLYRAPINNPRRILDIGTGTGIWAMEMGDLFPEAFVLGNDLSPIQPSLVPPNVLFEVDDVESPWTHNDPFDFIHSRCLSGAIADWPKLLSQIYQHTAPNGWAELSDYDLHFRCDDGTMANDRTAMVWIDHIRRACRMAGRDACPGPYLEGWMRDAGFTNIHHELLKLPVGIWPNDPHLKTIGAWNLLQILDGLEAFSLRLFTHVLGWEWEQLQRMLVDVRNDLRDPSAHIYVIVHLVYGQKVV